MDDDKKFSLTFSIDDETKQIIEETSKERRNKNNSLTLRQIIHEWREWKAAKAEQPELQAA